MYAIGGSSDPTILSEGNYFVASNDPNAKEVKLKFLALQPTKVTHLQLGKLQFAFLHALFSKLYFILPFTLSQVSI